MPALPVPSPWGRVALLGITQRTIRIKYTQKPRNRQRAKPLPENVKTLGYWVHINRRMKNITPSRLGIKMGIATALIYLWESNIGQPNPQQLEILANLFGIAPPKEGVFDPQQPI